MPDDLPLSTVAKMLLRAELEAQQVRPSDLAARLGISRQAANKLVSLDFPTKIDAIGVALAALGKKLVLGVEPA